MDREKLLNKRMTPENVSGVESFVIEILSDTTRLKLMHYLTYINEEKDLVLHDSFGEAVPLKIVTPKWMHSTPKLVESMYPFLYDDKGDAVDFCHVRPFDYLTTFNVSDLNRFDESSVFYKVVTSLLAMQSQTRFTSIWRALASVLYALDSKFMRNDHIIRRYVSLLLKGYTDTPFYEGRSGGFIFAKNKNTNEFNDCVSILPMMIYMLISVGTDIIVENITEGDAATIIPCYFNMANESYCDTKLRIKSKIRGWLTEGLHIIGKCEVIEWSPDGEALGVYVKNLVESGYMLDTIKATREERYEALQVSNLEIYNYLETKLAKLKNITDVEKLFRISHAMSNDRTYYKTLVELSLYAAVGPKVNERLVPAPMIIAEDGQGNKFDFTFDGIDEHAHMCEQYLKDAAKKIQPEVEAINFIQEWLSFLTTSSAGKKLQESEKANLTEFEKKTHNIRLIRVALEADKFYTHELFEESLLNSVTLVVRQQIDRRQRAIAGLSNAKLATAFLSYIIGRKFYKLSPSVAQGKQIGNMLDARMLLHSTTRPNGLTSSVDISGMDASIQPTIRPIYDTLTFNASRRPVNQPFGPIVDKFVNVTRYKSNKELIKTKYERLSAATQVLSFQSNTMQTSTIYDSKIFGIIKVTIEGTFESGRPDTSTHHTVLLAAAMEAAARMWRESGKPDVRVLHQEMGDDMCLLYDGRSEYCQAQAKFDADFLAKLGFKTTLDISSSQGIFLQQQVCAGRLFGLSNRVSLFTREHEKVTSSLASASAELRAVVDDMSSRVPSIEGLRLLSWAISLFCISRHTFNVDVSVYDKVVGLLKKYITVQEYKENARHKEKYKSRLLTIYVPFVWFFMYKGGEMSAPGFLKSDGTFTSPQFLTAPSGPYKRKLMIDIVGVSRVSKMNVIDSDLIRKYRFPIAQMFIDLNMTGLERKARITDEIEINIDKLGAKLNSLGLQDKIAKSEKAHGILLRQGVRLDDSILFFRLNETKIKQIAESGEVLDVNVQYFSDMLIKNLLAVLGNNGQIYPVIKLSKEDVYHLYDIEFLDTEVDITKESFFAYRCPLIFSMKGMNEMWALYALIGGPSTMEGNLKKEMASIRGRFSFFRYTDPIFVSGLKVYKYHKTMLDDFFDAVGINHFNRPQFLNALEYYDKFSNFKYDYTLSPRRIFILSDNVTRVQETCLVLDSGISLRESVSNVPLYETLMSTFAYLYVLTNIEDYLVRFTKFRVNLDSRLMKLLTIK